MRLTITLLLAKFVTMSRKRFETGLTRLAQHIKETSTQSAFAEKVGCSEPHLSLVLKGKRGLSMRLAKAISAASGIPLQELAA